MRTLHGFLAPVFVTTLFAVAGCGGSVSGVNERDGGGDPGDDGGDIVDASRTNPDCPAPYAVSSGGSCHLSGLTCPSAVAISNCQGSSHTLDCFCDGESWTCEQGTPTNCPNQVCPAPQAVVPGGSCGGSYGLQCSSSNIVSPGCNGGFTSSPGTCTCTSNGWSCPQALAAPCLPPPPPQSCPDPYSVYPYSTCYTQPGMVCPGNPQNCDGEVFYDALECEGYWTPVATTTCSIYGYPDASVSYDAGYYYDDAGYAGYYYDSASYPVYDAGTYNQ